MDRKSQKAFNVAISAIVLVMVIFIFYTQRVGSTIESTSTAFRIAPIVIGLIALVLAVVVYRFQKQEQYLSNHPTPRVALWQKDKVISRLMTSMMLAGFVFGLSAGVMAQIERYNSSFNVILVLYGVGFILRSSRALEKSLVEIESRESLAGTNQAVVLSAGASAPSFVHSALPSPSGLTTHGSVPTTDEASYSESVRKSSVYKMDIMLGSFVMGCGLGFGIGAYNSEWRRVAENGHWILLAAVLVGVQLIRLTLKYDSPREVGA